MTQEVFEGYFDLLKETLEKANVIEKSAQIYNCDESGMPHNTQETIAAKGTKNVRQCTFGCK